MPFLISVTFWFYWCITRAPCWRTALAMTVQEVVPSPDSSLDLWAASMNSLHPIFSVCRQKDFMFYATVTPSLVMIGFGYTENSDIEPGDHGSINTFLPPGPRVYLTALESLLAPCKIYLREVDPLMILTGIREFILRLI